jgi:hypothetical protein
VGAESEGNNCASLPTAPCQNPVSCIIHSIAPQQSVPQGFKSLGRREQGEVDEGGQPLQTTAMVTVESFKASERSASCLLLSERRFAT